MNDESIIQGLAKNEPIILVSRSLVLVQLNPKDGFLGAGVEIQPSCPDIISMNAVNTARFL